MFFSKTKLDFAAILDHKQVRHMYLPEWDNSIFIGGTEAGATMKTHLPNGEVLRLKDVAEIELGSKDEEFMKPDFIGEEVTGIVKYYNSFLMKHPFSKW